MDRFTGSIGVDLIENIGELKIELVFRHIADIGELLHKVIDDFFLNISVKEKLLIGVPEPWSQEIVYGFNQSGQLF